MNRHIITSLHCIIIVQTRQDHNICIWVYFDFRISPCRRIGTGPGSPCLFLREIVSVYPTDTVELKNLIYKEVHLGRARAGSICQSESVVEQECVALPLTNCDSSTQLAEVVGNLHGVEGAQQATKVQAGEERANQGQAVQNAEDTSELADNVEDAAKAWVRSGCVKPANCRFCEDGSSEDDGSEEGGEAHVY